MRRLLAALVLALVLAPHAAAAHGDEGLLEVVEATPSDVGSSVTYRVSLVYVNDGEPVGGATVTATAFLDDQPQPTITLQAEGDGIYAGTVTFPTPGRWEVRFASLAPDAQLRVTFDVAEPPPPTTTAPVATTTPPTATSTAATPELADADVDNDGPPAFLIVGLVVTGLLMVGIGVTLVVRRRRT